MSKAKPTKQQPARCTLTESKAAIAHAAQTVSIPARVALLSHALDRAINAAKNEGFTVLWRECEKRMPNNPTGLYVENHAGMHLDHVYTAVVFKAAADEDSLPLTGCDATWHSAEGIG
jgi:hypothetical protein